MRDQKDEFFFLYFQCLIISQSRYTFEKIQDRSIAVVCVMLIIAYLITCILRKVSSHRLLYLFNVPAVQLSLILFFLFNFLATADSEAQYSPLRLSRFKTLCFTQTDCLSAPRAGKLRTVNEQLLLMSLQPSRIFLLNT